MKAVLKISTIVLAIALFASLPTKDGRHLANDQETHNQLYEDEETRIPRYSMSPTVTVLEFIRRAREGEHGSLNELVATVRNEEEVIRKLCPHSLVYGDLAEPVDNEKAEPKAGEAQDKSDSELESVRIFDVQLTAKFIQKESKYVARVRPLPPEIHGKYAKVIVEISYLPGKGIDFSEHFLLVNDSKGWKIFYLESFTDL